MSKLFKKPFLIQYILIFIAVFAVFNGYTEDMNIIIRILSSLIVALFLLVPILIPYAIIKLGARKAYRENLSKIDFSKDKAYYRDIILNYSPAELSYIDDLKNLEEKDVCATILSLKLKNKITIENNKINIIDNSTNNLKNSEIYILEHITKNKVRNINYKRFSWITKTESINDNLIKPNFANNVRELSGIVVGYIIIKIISIVTGMIQVSNPSTQSLFMDIIDVLSIITSFCARFAVFFLIGYFAVKLFSFKRTDAGEEINVKLEGLKIFIKDFGNFEDREHKELAIWDDYLIYSVLFNIDKKAIKQLEKLI